MVPTDDCTQYFNVEIWTVATDLQFFYKLFKNLGFYGSGTLQNTEHPSCFRGKVPNRWFCADSLHPGRNWWSILYWPYVPEKRVRLVNSVLNYQVFSPSSCPFPRSASLQGQKRERHGKAGTRKLEECLHKPPWRITLHKMRRRLPAGTAAQWSPIEGTTSVLWHSQSCKASCPQNPSLLPVMLWCLHHSEPPGTEHVSQTQLKCTQLSEALYFCFVFGAWLHKSEEYGVIFFGGQALAFWMFPFL